MNNKGLQKPQIKIKKYFAKPLFCHSPQCCHCLLKLRLYHCTPLATPLSLSTSNKEGPSRYSNLGICKMDTLLEFAHAAV